MRLFLTTLTVMAVTAPAFAAEINRDPEGSIQQSDTVAYQPAANDVSKMEPAAGEETVKQYQPAQRPAHVATSTKMNKINVDQNNDAEGTVAPSRMVD